MRKMSAKELAKVTRNGKYHKGKLREVVREIINADTIDIPRGSVKITVETQKTNRNEEQQ